MKFGLFLAAFTAFAAAGFAPLQTPAARFEGEYALMPSADAQACALACEEDALCISWAYAEGQCALSAVAPARAAPALPAWGLSSRAPQFRWSAVPSAPAAIREAPPVAKPAFRGAYEPSDPAEALLGGPEPGELRLRFAGDRP